MKRTSLNVQPLISLIAILLFTFSSYSQVGIGTTNPNADALLDIDASINVGGLLLPRIALTSSANAAPLSAHVQGMTVYNTVTVADVTPGQYYNDGSQWVRVGGSSTQISSVSLNTDQTITDNAPPGPGPNYAAIPGMTLAFTATSSTAYINLTGSGLGYTNSMAYVSMRVMNNGVSIGGTMNKIQSYDDLTGTITPWSLAFSKQLTGLTAGTAYTLTIQAYAYGILGNEGAAIQALTSPDECHLTLTVMQ